MLSSTLSPALMLSVADEGSILGDRGSDGCGLKGISRLFAEELVRVTSVTYAGRN